MKAEELRIKNLVYFSFNEKKDIHLIVPKDLHVLSQFPNAGEYQPIPLTEERLLKAGFRKIITNGNWFKKDDFGIYDTFDAFSFKTCLWSSNSIQYVHQLQNLYFALTGTELYFAL